MTQSDRTTSSTGSRSSGSVCAAVSGLGSRLAFLAVAAFAVSAVAFFVLPSSASGHRFPSPDLTKLTASRTGSTLPKAPRDPHPDAATKGEVVHPRHRVALFAAPGRRPFAKIGPHQMGDTWLPVIGRHAGWSRVLLPSRPNGSTGWLRTAQVDRRTTPYLVRVHLGSRRLDLFHDGDVIGSWSVAVGAPSTPTPTGRTFVLGSITDPHQSYSPVILPLGAHSDTLDTYGGGPGTVALHGWPDTSVFGQAVSHGCVRVPADALQELTQVPLGTLVLVDEE